MALNFKQTSRKSHGKKPQPRHSKEYKAYKGRHMPTRKLMVNMWRGDYYNYVRASIERWLYSQVDRPIDKVFSDFVKEVKKTYKGDQPPSELFYNHIDKEKETKKKSKRWGNRFYVSESGFLCRYSKYADIPFGLFNRRRLPVKAHKDHNQEVLKEFKIGVNDYGPRYVGKLWATAKGVTKILNVWVVAQCKLDGKKGMFGLSSLTRKERENLAQYVTCTVAGFGPIYRRNGSAPKYPWEFDLETTYRFVVKLSDIQ